MRNQTLLHTRGLLIIEIKYTIKTANEEFFHRLIFIVKLTLIKFRMLLFVLYICLIKFSIRLTFRNEIMRVFV